MKKLLWVILIVVVVFGVWLFIKNPAQAPEVEVLEQDIVEDAPEAATGADEPRESTVGDMMPPTEEGVREFTVTGDNFAFDLKNIAVKVGETVRITFVNAEGKHDWRLDEFSAFTKILAAGAQETITFVADRAGTFEYYCSVGTHRQMGMKGTLTVTK